MAQKAGHRAGDGDDYPLLREALARLLKDDPFSRYGAHAVGIGRKVVRNKATRRLALRFYVAKKIGLTDLPRERRIPRSFRTLSAKQGREVDLPADVIESPAAELHLPDLESALRPVPGGASCSSSTSVGAGTIGGWVWDNTDDTIVMLSNLHVFGSIGGVIIQPGTPDGGQSPQDRIGTVKRSIALDPYVPRTPSDCRNFVDAAIGEADSSELFDLTVADIGPAVYDTADPAMNDDVEKTGQTTGHTFGRITDADYHVVLPYPDGNSYVICDCFLIEPSDPAQLWGSQGDSGSIVFRQDAGAVFKPALGLYFGGGGVPPNNYGFACKIGNVFAELDLGPLCIAGCAAFVDALYADEAEVGPGGFAVGDAGMAAVAPAQFTLKERQRAHRFHTGLTLDIRKRLMTSARGRGIVAFIDRHRGELLTLLVGDGDTRRALVAALRPILMGAVTTDDVLRRKLTEADIERIDRLAAVGAGKGSSAFRKSLKVLHALFENATGRSLADVLQVSRVKRE